MKILYKFFIFVKQVTMSAVVSVAEYCLLVIDGVSITLAFFVTVPTLAAIAILLLLSASIFIVLVVAAPVAVVVLLCVFVVVLAAAVILLVGVLVVSIIPFVAIAGMCEYGGEKLRRKTGFYERILNRFLKAKKRYHEELNGQPTPASDRKE